MQDKLQKRQSLYFDFTDVFEGSIEEVCKKIKNIPERLKKENHYFEQNSEIFIKFELDWQYCGHDGGRECNLYGIRLETDEEFNERIQTEKLNKEKAEKRKANKIAKEKALFDKLNKKYGK